MNKYAKKFSRLMRRVKFFFFTDAIILSFPKSGRTWLRVILAKYFSNLYNLPFTITLFEYKEKGDWSLPHIFFDHAVVGDTAQLNESYLKKKLKKKIIFLVRDPRDVVVSYFFQVTEREKHIVDEYFDGNSPTLAKFIRDESFGLPAIIRYMNVALKMIEKQRGDDYLLIRYCDLQKNGLATLTHLLDYAGVRNISKKKLKEAYEFSKFENMKRMEKNNKFRSTVLKPADATNPNSFKVRKGKVGGYVDYFDSEDLAYASKQVSRLDGRFGYQA